MRERERGDEIAGRGIRKSIFCSYHLHLKCETKQPWQGPFTNDWQSREKARERERERPRWQQKMKRERKKKTNDVLWTMFAFKEVEVGTRDFKSPPPATTASLYLRDAKWWINEPAVTEELTNTRRQTELHSLSAMWTDSETESRHGLSFSLSRKSKWLGTSRVQPLELFQVNQPYHFVPVPHWSVRSGVSSACLRTNNGSFWSNKKKKKKNVVNAWLFTSIGKLFCFVFLVRENRTKDAKQRCLDYPPGTCCGTVSGGHYHGQWWWWPDCDRPQCRLLTRFANRLTKQSISCCFDRFLFLNQILCVNTLWLAFAIDSRHAQRIESIGRSCFALLRSNSHWPDRKSVFERLSIWIDRNTPDRYDDRSR